MNCIVWNNKCIIDVRVCIIIGHVTDSIHSSNAHTPDERDPGSGTMEL